MPSPLSDEPLAIPVLREDARVGRESVRQGAVRVRVATRRERVELPIQSSIESVAVERRPVGCEVPDRREPWHEGEVLVVPVYEERLVTRTVLVLVEEVRLTARRETRAGVVATDLRHDVPRVERQFEDGIWRVIDDDGAPPPSPAGAPPFTSDRSTSVKQTVVAIFDRHADAEQARERLRQRGVPASSITVTDAPSGDPKPAASTEDTGVLASVRHFFSDLFSGGSDDDMGTYAEAVRRGGAVLKADVDDDSMLDLVRDELDAAGAADIDERSDQWQQQRTDPPAAAEPAAETRASAAAADGEVIPVVQESVAVGKRSVRAGGVRVYSRVVSEPVSETVALREERATVTRRPVDRPATQADLDAPEERTIEVTEMVERPVVEKTARVVEEVLVGKEVRQKQATVQETVRHTEVAVDTLDESADLSAATGADRLDREDYQQHYASAGGRYEDYQPAYAFGRSLRAEDRFTGLSWDEVEPHARSRWAERHPDSPWERVKDAARRSWDRLTD